MTLVSSGSRSDCLAQVDARLASFFDRQQQCARQWGDEAVQLWAELRRSAEGGKRIRPTLVVTTHQELGGADDEAAATVAAAFELLHTGFLLHDDVIDGDTLRRGRPNLIGAFADDARTQGRPPGDAAAWGRAAGILAGDLLIHAAQSLVARAEIDHPRRSHLLDLLDETLAVSATGQLQDVAFGTGMRPPELAAALAMTARKTAHYSFQAPLLAGAILARADVRICDMLHEFGGQVGIAFQLQDDLLGMFGGSDITGKSTTSDIDGAKVTPLVAYALRTAHGGELAALMDRPPRTSDDVAAVRGLLTRSGAVAFVRGLIDDHVAAAIDGIESAAVPPGLVAFLSAVARTAGNRDV